jgi:hypothetical protein
LQCSFRGYGIGYIQAVVIQHSVPRVERTGITNDIFGPGLREQKRGVDLQRAGPEFIERTISSILKSMFTWRGG